jgi:hypothetical protein
MIVLHAPSIVPGSNGMTRLQAEYEVEGTRKLLWFATTNEFGKYFTDDRGDAFLVPLLILAMKKKLPLVSKAPISERMLYCLRAYLQTGLLVAFPEWGRVEIDAPAVSNPVQNVGGVGTGLSCGVDSFTTIVDHLNLQNTPTFRLTHLTYFNVGGHSPLTSDAERTRELFTSRTAHIRRCAEDIGLPLVVVDSNVAEAFGTPFAPTSTYALVSAALALQRLFRVYLVSAGARINEMHFNSHYAGDSDQFSLPLVSTEGLTFYTAGSQYSRMEKTAKIAEYPLAQKYLDVCLYEQENCGVCEKCLRTQLSLESLGKLEDFSGRFKPELFHEARTWFVGYLIMSMNPTGGLRSIYTYMREHGLLSRGQVLYHVAQWYKRRLVNRVRRALGYPPPPGLI